MSTNDPFADVNPAQTPTVTPTVTPVPVSVTQANPVTQSTIVMLVVPLVTIIGVIVLIAIGKIDATAGLALVGVLVGVHGGAVATR